ncbi:RNA-directed DNA polymerase from mobile element jockey, partial [Araneus ventricosus]
ASNSCHSLENSFQENPEPYCSLHINEVNNSINSYFNNLATSSTPDLISSQEVINLIKKINPRKATGPDGVPNKAIRMLTLNAVNHLTKISINALSYNTSRMLGKLFMCLCSLSQTKIANILAPIDQSVILVTLALGKSTAAPTNYFESQTKLSRASTYTGGVFLDVRKAFDRMWHKGLIVKLIKYQFPDYLIKIIQRFLSHRKFQVKINQVLSSVGNIQAGTPQGSSLSCILYDIFNSDFRHNDKVLNCLFADDSAILTQGSNIRFIIKTLQSQIDSMEYWCTKWRVAINNVKTKAILFRKGHSSKVLKTLSFIE